MPKDSSMGTVSMSQKPIRSQIPHVHPAEIAILVIWVVIGAAATAVMPQYPWLIVPAALIGLFFFSALQVGYQWEKAVVLRMGRFKALKGPGAFFIIPVIDSVTKWIDHRVITTSFSAEQTLTMDTVPVDVDAVLFWMVWDAEKAAFEVQDYQQAVFWSAQTALRDVIGRTTLAEMLRGREKLDNELQKIIDQRTTPWGITVQSVEIRDVLIPTALQDSMSREAQAERERHARVILGNAEAEIAHTFIQAGKAYENNPTALHLRAMNMLYESLKEKGSMIVVPSTAVQSMGLGTITGMVAMADKAGQGIEPPADGEK